MTVVIISWNHDINIFIMSYACFVFVRCIFVYTYKKSVLLKEWDILHYKIIKKYQIKKKTIVKLSSLKSSVVNKTFFLCLTPFF